MIENQMKELPSIKDEDIGNFIFTIRGQQVMLDSDIAHFFNVDTKRLNQQMNRNRNRFPEDFCFQINSYEFKNQRSQNATFNRATEGRKYCPYVYTEQGVIALAGVIKNDFAVEMSIKIVRTFIQMRKFIAENGDVLLSLARIQNRQIAFEVETNEQFDEVLKLISKVDLPKQALFFEGQYYDAYDFISSIVRRANTSILLIDPYCDNRALAFLKNRKEGVDLSICKSTNSKLKQEEIEIFEKQYGELQIFDDDEIHDRFLIIDSDECYSLGTSLNYAGKKTFVVTKIENQSIIQSIVNYVNK